MQFLLIKKKEWKQVNKKTALKWKKVKKQGTCKLVW